VLIAVDGKEVAAPFDLKPAAKRGEVSRPVQFGARGCRVEVRNLRLFHDIYYTPAGRNGTREPTRLGPTEYFMLGDNSGNSQDSREWSVPGVPEADFIGKPFLVHQPLRLARVAVGGRERVFQTLDWSRLRWLR
jgi:signal peptidase I